MQDLKTFTVLGLDPSLKNIGAMKLKITFNVKDNFKVTGFEFIGLGLSETNPDGTKSRFRKKNEEDRSRAIEHREFLKEQLKGVDFVFCELPHGSQTARAMASYGIVIGLTAWIEIPFFVVSPTELKVVACNSKTATKQQMLDWATTKLPEAPWLTKGEVLLNKNEHIADALAAIVAGVQSQTFKQAMLKFK